MLSMEERTDSGMYWQLGEECRLGTLDNVMQ